MNPTTTSADVPVGLLCIFRPAAVRVLQAAGVDLALEHDRPLEEACAMRDIAVDTILDQVHRAERASLDEADWEILRVHVPRLTAPLPSATA